MFKRNLTLPVAVTILLCLNSNCLQADDDWAARIFKDVKIRKASSVGNDTDTQLPSSLQAVLPSQGDNSYSIDFGISKTSLYEPSERISFSLGAEYHKNDLIAVEQDTFLGGVSGYILLCDASQGFGLTQSLSVNYKNDDIGSGSGLFVKTNFFPISKKLGTTGAVPFADGTFEWMPHVGVQYETGDNLFDSGESGKTARINLGLEGALKPFEKMFDERLKITTSVSYWLSAGASDNYLSTFGKDQSLWIVLASLYFDEKKKFSGGIEYSDGAEPEQGRVEQKLFTVKLQFEFG